MEDKDFEFNWNNDAWFIELDHSLVDNSLDQDNEEGRYYAVKKRTWLNCQLVLYYMYGASLHWLLERN